MVPLMAYLVVFRNPLKNCRLASINPSVRILAMVSIVVFAIISTNIIFLLLLFSMVIFLGFLSQVNMKAVIKRISIVAPIIGGFALFQPFVRGSSPIMNINFFLFELTAFSEGAKYGIVIFLRGIVSVSSVIVFIATMTMYEFGISFRKLGVPKGFVSCLMLTLRYIPLLAEEAGRIMDAQSLRSAKGKASFFWRVKTIAGLMGNVLMRAWQRAENVHNAMELRGMHTNIPLSTYNISIKDVASYLALITLCFLFLFILTPLLEGFL